MTKHEADVIGALNMTDQISNEAYKQIMIAAQDETEVCDVLDEIRAEIALLSNANPSYWHSGDMVEREDVYEIIDKYKAESEE